MQRGQLNLQVPANTFVTYNLRGNFLLIEACLGQLIVTMDNGETDYLDGPGALCRYDKDFRQVQIASTVANDVVRLKYGFGFSVDPTKFPGGSSSTVAVVAETQDEVSPLTTLAIGANLFFSFKYAVPSTKIYIPNELSPTGTGYIGIQANDFFGNSYFPPVYDCYGNQQSDQNGNISAAQLGVLINEADGLGANLFLDTSGAASVTIGNQTTVAGLQIGVTGQHLPVSHYIGMEHTQPTYRMNAANWTPAATPTDALTIIPGTTGGLSATGGYLYLERLTLWMATTAAAAAVLVNLIRRNTLDSGGTFTSLNASPNSPLRNPFGGNYPHFNIYTANPTGLGTQNDVLDSAYINIPAVATGYVQVVFDYRTNKEKPQIPFYNGSTWEIGINLGGATLTGLTMKAAAEFKYF